MIERPLDVDPEPAPPGAAASPQPAAVEPAAAPATASPRRVLALRLAVAGTALLACAAAAGAWLAGSRFTPVPVAAAPAVEPSAAQQRLQRQLDRLAPRGHYAVVDTYQNRLRVYRGGELLRAALCSTGSGLVLKDQQGGREWTFDTPRGERQVIRKTRNPVWIKPDWAFIEEGYLPPTSFADRRDDVSLGDYGLYLGDGYLIHGTLFKSLLGRKVTHGCIRLGDEDLEFAYQKLALGARVYLY